MKKNKAQNAIRNMVFGVILKLYQIVVPFIMRTILLYYLGIEYLGLNSLFTSLLQILNLAELGVGSALVFSMYEPIVQNDTNKICALLNLYKKYYRIIGLVISVLGLCLLPFIKVFIKGDIPLNIYILYLINLSYTISSYWLFAYKNSLLTAHQRIDVIHKVTLLTDTIKYILQIIILIKFRNYYAYIILNVIGQILNNLFVAKVASKYYPQYKAQGLLNDREIMNINKKVKDLFTAKLGGVIVGSTDTVVISAFLGITVLAVYQNYFYILNSIIGFMVIIYHSCLAGIGNSLLTNTKEKNFRDFEKFSFIITWIILWCSICLICLYQVFMKIWVGKTLMLENSMVICFVIYFMVYEFNQIFITYKDAAGIWHEDRYRPLIVSVSNLILNIFLVQFIGLFGVLLSTILTTALIGIPWLIHNVFSKQFNIKPWKYILKEIKFLIVAMFAWGLCEFLFLFLYLDNNILELVVRGIICTIIPNFVFTLMYYKTDEFKYVVLTISRSMKKIK